MDVSPHVYGAKRLWGCRGTPGESPGDRGLSVNAGLESRLEWIRTSVRSTVYSRVHKERSIDTTQQI